MWVGILRFCDFWCEVNIQISNCVTLIDISDYSILMITILRHLSVQWSIFELSDSGKMPMKLNYCSIHLRCCNSHRKSNHFPQKNMLLSLFMKSISGVGRISHGHWKTSKSQIQRKVHQVNIPLSKTMHNQPPVRRAEIILKERTLVVISNLANRTSWKI